MISLYEPCHQVTIREHAPGIPVITVDGHELRTVTGATLQLRADNLPPVLQLRLLTLDGLDVDTPARVLLDDATTAALVGMGWTPPGTVTGRDGEGTMRDGGAA